MAHITRREFVGGAVALSGLTLSLELPAQETARQAAPGAARPPRTPSAFLQIGEDDGITIITPAVEMGQGGHTSMPMIIMEELGGNWGRLRVADAPAAAIYNNPLFGLQATVGSFRSAAGTWSCGGLARPRESCCCRQLRRTGKCPPCTVWRMAARLFTSPAGADAHSAAWPDSRPTCLCRRIHRSRRWLSTRSSVAPHPCRCSRQGRRQRPIRDRRDAS